MGLPRVRLDGRVSRLGWLFCVLLALSPVAAPATSAQDDEPPWERVFEEILPRFEAARAGEGTIEVTELVYLYEHFVMFRARHRDEWPTELDFDGTVDALHDFGAARGVDPNRFALEDYYLTLHFEEAGRRMEGRAHLERVIDRYPVGTPYLPHLLTILAGYARYCRQWEAALDLVAAAERAQLNDSTLPLAIEGRVVVNLEKVALWIGLGLHERAIEAAAEARAAVGQLDNAGLRSDVLFEELNLYIALDDFDSLARTLAEARAADWYADVHPGVKADLDLRYALALAEQERLNPELERRAAGQIQALLEGGALFRGARLLATVRLADVLLDAGRVDEAESLVADLEVEELSGLSSCGFALPSRRAIDVSAVRARVAQARGGPSVAAALPAARRSFERLLDTWREVPESDAGLGWLHTADRLRATEAYLALLIASGDGRQALEAVAQVQAIGSLAQALGAPTPSLEDVLRELVPARGGLLLVLPGAVQSHAFCVDAERVSTHALAPIYRLDPARRTLVSELRLSMQMGAASPGLDPAIAAVSRLLLPAALLERMSGWDEVAIVGRDGVGYVPYELLEFGAERVGDRFAVSYPPSLPVGVHLARARRSGSVPRVYEVVAATDAPLPGQGLAALPFGKVESHALFGDASGVDWRVHAGSGVSAASLASADWREAFALHVLAHGVETGEELRPRGLLLPGGEVLTPALTETLRVPPLVILTACGAWDGPLRRGDDGRGHLGGSLMIAGAETLVLSHLPVDYRENLTLIGVFNEGVAMLGLSPAQALRRARRVVGDRGGYPGRYLVHVAGLGHTPLAPQLARGPDPLRWIVLAGVALAGLAVVWRLRAARAGSRLLRETG